MAQYLRLFETVNEFNSAYTGEEYIEPWVSYTEENEHVDYNKQPVPVTMRLYYSESQYQEEFSQTKWENAVAGQPVETITFNSLEEFFAHHFERTSPLSVMTLVLGIHGDGTYDSQTGKWYYTNFQNTYRDDTSYIVMAEGENVSYVTPEQACNPYTNVKELIADYLTEHGEINIVYYAHDWGA